MISPWRKRDEREKILRKELGDLRRQPCKCSCGKTYQSAAGLSRHILLLREREPHKMGEVLWTDRQKEILKQLDKL